MPKQPANVQTLVRALYESVEGPQGYAHIPSEEQFATVEEFLERTRLRLAQAEIAAKRIRDFLGRYSQ